LDEKIILALKQNARISNSALSKTVGLSESACWRRLKSLEQSGAIKGYTAILADDRKQSVHRMVVQVTLERKNAAACAAFESRLRSVPNVSECYLVSGVFDYLVMLNITDVESFKRFVDDELMQIAGVAQIQSFSTLKKVV
jgi:DNA-binding Lrp family transcriptional regulator